MTAALHSRDWPEAPNQVNFEQAANLAGNRGLVYAYQQFEAYVDRIRNKNEDLADVQEKSLMNHLENQRKRLIEIRDTMRLKAQCEVSDERKRQQFENLARAREAQIQQLEARVEQRRLGIQKARQLRADNEDIAVGVIRVL